MPYKYTIEDPPLAKFLFSSSRTALFWLIVRVYVGWVWLSAGWVKIQSAEWVGVKAGQALSQFIEVAVLKVSGAHPDVQLWYGWFLENMVLPNAADWSHLITWSEFFVGLALITGTLTGLAAFAGAFLNFNYLLAGTVSINPILFVLTIGLILAWKVAGFIGMDRVLLPFLGTPWHPGFYFEGKEKKQK